MKTGRVIGEKGADGVASLTFSNEARRNAITLAMSEEASALLEDYAADPSVHLLVISGAGEHFVSGADISEFEALRAEPEAIARYEAISSRMFTLVRTSRNRQSRKFGASALAAASGWRPPATCASPPTTAAIPFPPRAWASPIAPI